MFTRGFYVPVLTGKAGELSAIGGLPDPARSGFTPVIDVPPFPRSLPAPRGAPDRAEKLPPNPALELDGLVDRIAKHWGLSRRVIVDLDGAELYRPNGLHPVTYVLKRARNLGLIAAVAVSSESTPEYRAAVLRERLTGNQMVLRLHVDVDASVRDLRHRVCRLVDDMGAATCAADLIVDFGRLPVDALPEPVEIADRVRAVVGQHAFRSMALVSTSLPDFSSLAGGSFLRAVRHDWLLWRAVRDLLPGPFAFGDYGITGPRKRTDDPARGPSPHLRYSRDDVVYIWKGKPTRTDNVSERGTTYPDLCGKLLDYRVAGRQVFRGRAFSPGDDSMWAAARTPRGPGGGKQWVEYATSHHLREVVTQLESLV